MFKEQKQTKSFGMAKDYYRARLLRVFEERPDDLEWREDILYRAPKAYPSKVKVTYRLQVLTTENKVIEFAILESGREAKRRYKKMARDLGEMTKMGFDETYGIEEVYVIVKPELVDVMYFSGVQNVAGRTK
ncbi:MAG: hypothetical protein KGZ93_04585 [Actinobacteria bacterium]|nr:hypothetical protein [Actinomycetota bacterium]